MKMKMKMMKMKSPFLAIAGVLLFMMSTPLYAETDLTNGLAADEISQIMAIQPIISSVGSGGNILWDTSHGIYINYSPSGDFSYLKSLLESTGYTIDENSSGILNLDLSNYDIIVICLGSAWGSAYSAEEVEAINNFVNNCGGLLIMGENTSCPNSNINPVSAAFGTTLGLSDLYPLDLYIDNLTSHPIFDGVSEIYMRAAGEISGTSPSSEEAWTDDKAAVTVADLTSGHVVTLADINIMDNGYLSYSQNQLLAENVFAWLADPCPYYMDIKPGSCPNPLNVKSKGVLPVAVLGAEGFDVTQVNPPSIRLEGVAPLRWAYADVATPFTEDKVECDDCNELCGDGYMDLVLNFDTQEVVAALGPVEDEDCLVLELTGNLKDEFSGTPMVSEDVVRILKKGNK